MRVFILCFISIFLLFATEEIDNKELGITKAKEEQEEKSLKDYFLTAEVTSPYYASLGVNFTYSHFKNRHFDSHSFNSLTFMLDFGGILLEKKNLLLGFYLDGSAGGGRSNALYGLFTGLKIAGRLFDGRIVPYTKIGGSYFHLPFDYNGKQFNAYGLDLEAGLFVDIGKGYGLNLSYRYGYNKAFKLKLDTIHTSIVMFGFSYYDFSLDW